MRVAAVVVGAVVVVTNSCGPRCDSNGFCASGGRTSATLSAGTDVADATATVCDGSECASCTFAISQTSCSLSAADFDAHVSVTSMSSAGQPSFGDAGIAPQPLTLSVGVVPHDPASLHDGDVWSFSLTSAQGATLSSTTTAVTYFRENVCGTTCVSWGF